MDKTPSNSPLKGEEGFQEVSSFRFQEVSGGQRGFRRFLKTIAITIAMSGGSGWKPVL